MCGAPASSVPYAELHAHSAYSFLDGASTPEELVEEAARLDLRAIALTDHDGLYGVVRFAEAAKELDIATVFGAELSLGEWRRAPRSPIRRGRTCWCWPVARRVIGGCRVELATAHLAGGEKGKPRYDFDALTEAAGGHWHILTGCRKGHVRQALATGGPDAAAAALADLVDRFGRDRVSIELTHHGHPLDDERNAALAELAPRFGLGARRHHRRAFRRAVPGSAGDGDGRRSGPATRWTRRPVTLRRWAVRTCGRGRRWRRLFAHCPEVVTAAAELGEQCAFGLALIAPQLPPFDVPDGHTEDSWLRHLVMTGARKPVRTAGAGAAGVRTDRARAENH